MRPIPDLERLRTVFAGYPEIQAVYLFGSAAMGRLRPESDLDLAIVPRTPGLRARKLDLLTDLARQGFCDAEQAGRVPGDPPVSRSKKRREAERWLQTAEEDLRAAELLMQNWHEAEGASRCLPI